MGRKWKFLYLLLAAVLILGAAYLKARRERIHDQMLIRQAEELESVMASLGQGEAELQRNLAKWYNYNLEQGTPGLEESYEAILNFGQGRMAVLGVPEWDLKLTIYHDAGGVAGHDPSTPLPLGGRGNHTVLRLSEALPWADGMSLYIDCMGQRLTYRVESVQVMEPSWSPERPTEGKLDLLTLVYDRKDTRMLVRCVRCSELVLREGKTVGVIRYAAPAAALPVFLLLAVCRNKWRIFSGQRA